MFIIEGKIIKMVEFDFGEILPIRLKNMDFQNNDIIKFIIYDNEENIFFNESFEIKDSIIEFKLTKEQSAKLTRGDYNYAIKQYRGDELVDTLGIDNGFVVRKGIKEK